MHTFLLSLACTLFVIASFVKYPIHPQTNQRNKHKRDRGERTWRHENKHKALEAHERPKSSPSRLYSPPQLSRSLLRLRRCCSSFSSFHPRTLALTYSRLLSPSAGTMVRTPRCTACLIGRVAPSSSPQRTHPPTNTHTRTQAAHDPEQLYTLGVRVGKGSFGEVYKAYVVAPLGSFVAPSSRCRSCASR